MQFIGTGDRILTENFNVGYLYTITFKTGIYINSACIGIGDNFVMFQKAEPDLLFTLNVDTANEVDTIELYDSGGGTNDYDDLVNRPQINSHTLTGNMSGADLGLQATISDLDTIRAGAAAGATAVQPADMTSALAAKQNALTTEQLAAVNSSITSTDVAQIETNKNNISLNNNALCQIINTDSKNMLKLNRDRIKGINVNGTWVDYTFTPIVQPNLHITINNDFSITYTGTSSGDFSFAIYAEKLPDLQGYVLSGTTNVNNNYVSLQKSTAPYTIIAKDEGNGAIISEYSNTDDLTINVTIRTQATDIETTMSPMICTKDYWDITKTYAPYNYITDYTTCYSATSNDGTFAGVLANAIQSKGVSGVISYIASIYTATSNEYLLLYGLFSLNTLHNCVKIVNNTINFVAANNGGTIAVRGGTGVYTAKIKLLI